MPVEHILHEIAKRELKKEQLLNQLLEECKIIIEKLSKFKESSSTFRPPLPTGVIGRRLSDKISYLEKVVDESLRIEKSSIKDLEKLEKALFLVTEHLKNHNNVYEIDESIAIPHILDDIRNEFIILTSLQTNLKNNYIEHCINELKQRINRTDERMEKLDIKQTYEVYVQFARVMPFDSISRLKTLNDEYGNILSPGFIAREYKSCDEKLWHAKEDFTTTKAEREKFKESAKHLTHLQKCEAKSKAYMDEIDKHYKKLELLDEDSRHEIQELIISYKEAHKIMQDEIIKIKEFISKEYGIENVDEYHKKSTNLQVQEANLEIETRKLEKRSGLLANVLNDIHECRRRINAIPGRAPNSPYEPNINSNSHMDKIPLNKLPDDDGSND